MSIVGNYFHRCIYVYEFSNNYFYVGLTYNLEKRHLKHLTIGPVCDHIKKTNEIPKLKKLTNYINKDLASKLEDIIINIYVNDDWKKLNKYKGGNLGGGITIYTKEKCLEIAKKCKNRSELCKNHGAYLSAKKNNWLDELYSFIPQIVKTKNFWTKEKCHLEALKFSSKKEFRKNSISAYNISIRKKWLNEITTHMHTKKIQKGYWTKEKCLEYSKLFSNRTLFREKFPGAYKACRKNKWLDQFFPKR